MMTERILPRPVKKNKRGELVATIPVDKYYKQIIEEVFEAHEAEITKADIDFLKEGGCGMCVGLIEEASPSTELEEIVDIITCCVTRIDILGGTFDATPSKKYYGDHVKEFYSNTVVGLMKAYFLAIKEDKELEIRALQETINYCLWYLRKLGYNAAKIERQYKLVNEKNARRGYFEIF